MCLSKIGQIAYGALAGITVGLIIISIFTERWKAEDLIDQKNIDLIKNESALNFIKNGLFSFTCFNEKNNATGIQNCIDWFNQRPEKEKIYVSLMIVALALSVTAFIWNLLTFFAICCPGSIKKPLTSLASFSALILLIAICFFYYNNQDQINYKKFETTINHSEDYQKKLHSLLTMISEENNIAHSFYMGVGAFISSFANAILAFVIIFFDKICL